MFRSISRSAIAMMAALTAGVGMTMVIAPQPTIVQSAPRVVQAGKRSLFGNLLARPGRYGRKGAGVSMAQQHRTAAKRRSVARNRRHHR